MNPIIVINPNSTEAVTVGIDRSIAPLRMAGGPPIECLTLKEGPPGIESQETSDSVIMPLCRLIRSREDRGVDVGERLAEPDGAGVQV